MARIAFVGAGGGGPSGGTYSQRGTAGTLGQRFTTTDCSRNDWLDDGTAWRPVIAGVACVEPPLTGTFTNAINANKEGPPAEFSIFTQLSGSFLLQGINDSTSEQIRGFTKSFSSATAYVEFHPLIIPDANTQTIGGFPGHHIIMRNSSSGKMYSAGFHLKGQDSSTYLETTIWSSPSAKTYYSNWIALPGGGESCFVRISRDATNIYTQISRDRRIWVTYETKTLDEVFGSGSEPDEIGIGTLGFKVVPRMIVVHFASGSSSP